MKLHVMVVCLGVALGAAQPSFGQVGIGAAGQPAANARPNVSGGTIAPPGEAGAPDYIIGPDDLLGVVFWRDQQLSGDVLVRADGKISVPLLDDVQAAGLTPTQLRDRLVSEARRFVTEPTATVVVRQANSRRVYITGLVARPGQYPLTASMTVLQLIATAGGLQDYAKSKDIFVMRVERGQQVKLRFDYDVMTKAPKKSSPNIELRSGDTVVVP